MKEIKETHQKGFLSIEIPNVESQLCDLGIQIAKDGRIWLCINGQAFIRFKPERKESIKQLKKTRKQKDYCILPTCSRCSIRLHNDNAYKKSNGQFTTYCRTCNTDMAIIKAWRNKGFAAIQDRIIHYEHMIELLLEATDQLKERSQSK